MSSSPEHLDPKEATEAKLCAYLEGELPPSERAEIEQHLTANPQHRKLLADLAQTREWMRVIPRENAPSDLAESFQGHVERNMLLDDAGNIGPGMSMTRWPQYAMVAAIIVLVLGLGVTLVIILKGPGQLPVAMSGPTAAATKPTETPSPTDAFAKKSLTAVPPATAISPIAMASAPVVPAATPAAPTGAVGGLRDSEASALTAGAANAEEIKTKLAASGYRVPSESKTICFVVRSDSPATTVGQVHDFFIRHQLLVEQPANLAPNANQQAQPYAQHGSKNANTQADAATPPAAQNVTPVAGAANSNNNSTTANAQQQNNTQFGTAANDAVAGGNTNAATPAPAVDGPAETLYVAHGLTPLQLALLNASLAENNPNQPVNRFTLTEGLSAVQRPPAPNSLVKGQTLTVTIPQLIGPGIEKTNVVKVADDGSISLPMIDPVQAIGITAGELEQRITAKYREANLIADATVTVFAGPATQPSTMPATAPIVTGPIVTGPIVTGPIVTGPIVTGPTATTPLAAALPTTRQTQLDQLAVTTQPAQDQGVDVVVVIEKTAGK
jgi:anti-sigma factor RsiW